MKPGEFRQILERFRRGALPGRNLYLWCGPLSQLSETIGTGPVAKMSVLELPGITATASADQTVRMLQTGLSDWIRSVIEGSPQRSIAVLYDLESLAHYKIGVERIYLDHANDRRMTFLCAPLRTPAPEGLPTQLKYNPAAAQSFYRQLISPSAVVEVEDHGASTD